MPSTLQRRAADFIISEFRVIPTGEAAINLFFLSLPPSFFHENTKIFKQSQINCFTSRRTHSNMGFQCTQSIENNISASLKNFPFATHPETEAMSAIALTVPKVAPPTAVVPQGQIVLHTPGSFNRFPFFPPEIRLKVWKANLRPQTLHVIYDINLVTRERATYLRGRQYRAAWRFTCSPAANMPNRSICQESRAEAEKQGYEVVRLKDNITEARWFNPEVDSLFLDTNARAQAPYDEGYYEHFVDNVLPPVAQPFLHKDVMCRVRVLAVSDALWTDWPFSSDNGSNVSCEMCPGFHWDNTMDDFKRSIAKMKALEKLMVVRTNSEAMNRVISFKESQDQYGTSLLKRVNDWKVEQGLDFEVEIVQFG